MVNKFSQYISQARQAERFALELAKELADEKWHRTSELAAIVGQYIKPEVVWRATQIQPCRSMIEGRRKVVNAKLFHWEKAGRLEKRQNGKFVEWRVKNLEWLGPYLTMLSILVDDLKAGKT